MEFLSILIVLIILIIYISPPDDDPYNRLTDLSSGPLHAGCFSNQSFSTRSSHRLLFAFKIGGTEALADLALNLVGHCF